MLVVAPWSVFWERNILVELVPVFRVLAEWPVVRGAVSGVGLVNLGAGVLELVVALGAVITRWRSIGPDQQTQQKVDAVDPVAHEDLSSWNSD